MNIAVLSSHTPSLFWFRLDMMCSFLEKGHTVYAIGNEPEEDWKDKFQEYGIVYRQIRVKRNGTNPMSDIKTFFDLVSVLKQVKPDKIFAYQAKTVIYGSVAAKFLGIKEVYSLIAGAGSVFSPKGFKQRIVSELLRLEYKIALKNAVNVFFQNHDDSDMFVKKRILSQDKIVYLNGSGVDTEKFTVSELPKNPTFLFIGRLIKDKGVMEYLEACRQVKKEIPKARCMLIGPFDTNPTAISEEELQCYIDDGTVEYYGEQTDIKSYMDECSIYVLPSYHEGTPKTVLEAMSCGRAIITTDAPGCRETVTNELNGFLVPVKNIDALKEKMVYLANNPQIAAEMGEKSRNIAVTKFDVRIVNSKINNTMKIHDTKEKHYATV